MYRLPFELTDSAKLLHFTILGGGVLRPPVPPLNDATASNRNRCEMGITELLITEGFVISIRLLVRYLFFLLILVFYVGNSGFCKQIEVVEKIPFFVD